MTTTIDSIAYGHRIGNSYIKVQPLKDTPHLYLNQHLKARNPKTNHILIVYS